MKACLLAPSCGVRQACVGWRWVSTLDAEFDEPPDALPLLLQGVAPPAEPVADRRIGVVVLFGFPGMPRGDAADQSLKPCQGTFGQGCPNEGAVGAMPGDVPFGVHCRSDSPVGFRVMMLPAQALQVRGGGPPAGGVVDHVVDVALVCGYVAAGVAACKVP